jgi:hypothetical protein
MKKAARHLLKRRSKNLTSKAKNKGKNVFVENARKLLSGDINFFNKLKEKNLRRRMTATA